MNIEADTQDEKEMARRGKQLAEILGLKKNRAGRYDTTWGDKTEIGLYRTARRVLEGEMD